MILLSGWRHRASCCVQERIRRNCDAALGPWSLGESEEQGKRMMMMIMVSVVLRIGMSTLLLLIIIIIIINRWT